MVYKYVTYYVVLLIEENCLENRADQKNQKAAIRKTFSKQI